MPIEVQYGDAPLGGAYMAGLMEARQRNAQIVAQQMAAQADQMRAMAANSAAQQQARDAAEERASRMQIAGAEIGSRFDLQNNEAQIQAQRDYRQADIQTQLNQTQLNQAEQMRLQRLQRQMNYLDEQGPNGNGTYTQPEIDYMRAQLQTGISPLQERHQRAQALTDELKQKLMIQQAQRDAVLQKTHQDLMNRIDPQTGLATFTNENGEPMMQAYWDGHRMVPIRQRGPQFNAQRAHQAASIAVNQELRSFNTPPLPGQPARPRPAWLQRDPALTPILGPTQWPGLPLGPDEVTAAVDREVRRRLEEAQRAHDRVNGWRGVGEHMPEPGSGGVNPGGPPAVAAAEAGGRAGGQGAPAATPQGRQQQEFEAAMHGLGGVAPAEGTLPPVRLPREMYHPATTMEQQAAGANATPLSNEWINHHAGAPIFGIPRRGLRGEAAATLRAAVAAQVDRYIAEGRLSRNLREQEIERRYQLLQTPGGQFDWSFFQPERD